MVDRDHGVERRVEDCAVSRLACTHGVLGFATDDELADLAAEDRRGGEQQLVGLTASRVKNSIAPRNAPPLLMESRRRAEAGGVGRWARGKLASGGVSAIQVGSPESQTRPGSPSPGASVICSVIVRNSDGAVPEASQIPTQRSASPEGASSQTAPNGQPSVVPIAASTLGYVSALLSVSASASATACSTRRSPERVPSPSPHTCAHCREALSFR